MRVAGIALTAALLLTGCAEPLPADKAAYAGNWRSKDVSLTITPDGRVEYERRSGASTTSVKAPIRKFEGNNFIVGVGPVTTTFVVSRPPYQDGAVWKMVVDGVELVKGGETEGWKA